MAMTPETVRVIFRDFDLSYKDSTETDSGWNLNFYFPIDKYRFDGREGLRTNVTLKKVWAENSSDYDYMSIDIYNVYHTNDMSLLGSLYKLLNSCNGRWYFAKWNITTGPNEEGVDEIRVHLNYEIALENHHVTTEQFWRIHAAMWHSVQGSWEQWAEALGIPATSKIDDLDLDLMQDMPENIADLNKEKVLELFDTFLNEKFDNV
jgi:hypothetical protein